MEKVASTEVSGKLATLGYFVDVTERNRLEEQVAQLQRVEAIAVLAGGVAHDFNNLLTAIMAHGEIMLMEQSPDHPIYSHVEDILKAAKRGESLTHQLLAFSRKQVLQPRVFNLNEAVAEMEKMLRRLIGEDIELISVLEEHLGLVKADPGQVEQIIMNLAVNARDAMPRGGKLTLETANVYLDHEYAQSHPAVAPGPYVMLAVSDTGLGMDAQTQSRIFEPFFTTKELGRGTGLGLATVYGIVKQSGGYIWVYSEMGQGTTFKVYFPQVTAELGLIKKPEPIRHDAPQGQETILVVEDDELLRTIISRALSRFGYQVLAAAHGAEALETVEHSAAAIHLLITDVVMPHLNGPELAARLTALYPEMKVLYMSGYTDNAIVHHGVLDHALWFLQKPFPITTLLQKVREVLDAPPTT
jgi:nitrogen-specific signal transduction histidine kinase/ActR/RegA family two-component response regulator